MSSTQSSGTRRRRFLAAVSVAGLGAIAGCSSVLGGGGGEPTPTPPDEEVQGSYDTAVDVLFENKETLDEWAFRGPEVDQEIIGELRDRVATARTEFDALESSVAGDSDRATRTEQLRNVATFQDETITYYERFFEVNEHLGTAESHVSAEEYEQAAEAYEEASSAVGGVREQVDSAESAHAEIDNDALGESLLDYSGEFIQYIHIESREELAAYEDFSIASAEANRGIATLQEGLSRWENDAYADARGRWEDGQSSVEQARDSFEAVVDNDASPGFMNRISTARIEDMETVGNALATFIEAANEAEAGNVEKAEELLAEGRNLLAQPVTVGTPTPTPA